MDTGMLAAGFVFLALGAIFLADRLGIVQVHVNYILPVVLISIGLAVLIGGLQARRQRSE
jgi:hypothetical protein